jgi:hypothetical protein
MQNIPLDAPSPDAAPSPRRIPRPLTSWKVWLLALIVGFAGIAAALCFPVYRRWQAISYLESERISFAESNDVRWLKPWIGEARKGLVEVSRISRRGPAREHVLVLGEFNELQNLDYFNHPPRSLTAQEVDALTSLHNLQWLRLEGLQMSDRELADWITSCPKLARLWLINTGASVETLRVISTRPSITAVTIQNDWDVDASAGDIPRPSPLQFVERGPFAMKWIHLEGVPTTDDFLAEWISSCPQLIHVELLEAGAGVLTLQAVSKLPQVTKLWLRDDALSDDDFAVMQAMPLLEQLFLGGRALTGEGIASFADSSGIRWLGMDGTSISDEGLAQVAQLTSLESLSLCNCPNVRPSGIAALASMPNLEGVCFTPEMVTPEIVAALHDLPALKYVDIVGWPLDEALISAIEERWSIGWK